MRRKIFCLLLGLVSAAPVLAQSGIVLFGADGNLVLDYRLSKNRVGSQQTTYELRLKPQKVAIRQFQIQFPDRWSKSFDTNRLEILGAGTSFAVDYAQLDPETRSLIIGAKEPVPSGVAVTLKFKNVTNPRAPGIHKLRASLLGTEPNPIFRYVGDWFISLE